MNAATNNLKFNKIVALRKKYWSLKKYNNVFHFH